MYGTLRPDRAPPAIAGVVATLQLVARAKLRGRLYDLGAYPGAVFEPTAPGFVHGDVVETSPASPSLEWFDAYEGDEFRRERHEVETDARARVACWSWALVRAPAAAKLVVTGRWESRRDRSARLG